MILIGLYFILLFFFLVVVVVIFRHLRDLEISNGLKIKQNVIWVYTAIYRFGPYLLNYLDVHYCAAALQYTHTYQRNNTLHNI